MQQSLFRRSPTQGSAGTLAAVSLGTALTQASTAETATGPGNHDGLRARTRRDILCFQHVGRDAHLAAGNHSAAPFQFNIATGLARDVQDSRARQ